MLFIWEGQACVLVRGLCWDLKPCKSAFVRATGGAHGCPLPVRLTVFLSTSLNCSFSASCTVLLQLCVPACLADILYWVSVCLEDAPSRHKYWQRKPETQARVWKLTIRLGSHPSSHAEKAITPAFLISRTMSCYWNTQKNLGFMLQLWLFDIRHSYYGPSSPLPQLFLFFFFFGRLRDSQKKNRRAKRNKSMHADWQPQYRENYWVHHWHFFEVYLFEILEGSPSFWLCLLCGSLMGGVQSARPSRLSERQVSAYSVSPFHSAPLSSPPISLSVTLLLVSLPDATSATLRVRANVCLSAFSHGWMHRILCPCIGALHVCAQFIVMEATDNLG